MIESIWINGWQYINFWKHFLLKFRFQLVLRSSMKFLILLFIHFIFVLNFARISSSLLEDKMKWSILNSIIFFLLCCLASTVNNMNVINFYVHLSLFWNQSCQTTIILYRKSIIAATANAVFFFCFSNVTNSTWLLAVMNEKHNFFLLCRCEKVSIIFSFFLFS